MQMYHLYLYTNISMFHLLSIRMAIHNFGKTGEIVDLLVEDRSIYYIDLYMLFSQTSTNMTLLCYAGSTRAAKLT